MAPRIKSIHWTILLLLVMLALLVGMLPAMGDGVNDPRVELVFQDQAGIVKNQFELGDTVSIYATYIYFGVPADDMEVNLEIQTPGGQKIPSQETTANGGQAVFSFQLNTTASVPIVPGAYQVSANAPGLVAAAVASFTVVESNVDQSVTPSSELITMLMNLPGTNDTISGIAGAVSGGAEVNIYSDQELTQLISSGVADQTGAFGAIAVGDNLYGMVYLAATDPGKTESQAIALANDIEAPTITDYQITPDTNIGVGRPASITATAGESVSWTVEVRRPNGSLASARYYYTGASLQYSWAPANKSQPSGEYSVTLIAADVAGNMVSVIQPMPVYNYSVVVSSPQVLKADGTVANPPNFQPGMFYQVEATFTNLGPGSITPLAIVQTVEKVGSSTNLISLGSVKIPIPEGESVTLAVGAMAPTKPGTYYAQVFAWNDWPSIAGSNYQNLAPMGEVVITVTE